MSLYEELGFKPQYREVLSYPEEEGKSYEVKVLLIDGPTKPFSITALNRSDVLIEIAGIAEFEGWDESIVCVAIGGEK